MAAGATYEPIATQTLASAAATITFSSIAATYTDLRLIFAKPIGGSSLLLRFNSDTATNYSWTYLEMVHLLHHRMQHLTPQLLLAVMF